MAPSADSAASTSATPFAKIYNGSFLPSSLGNAIACYSSAAATATEGSSNDSTSSSKGKGKSVALARSGKGKTTGAADDGDVKFVEFDTLKRSRRTFVTETYTVYASLQIIASKFQQEELEDADHRALALRNEDIPPPEQVSYYSRFAQLYREAINRYLLELSSQNEIDTSELATMSAIRDVLHLAHIIYIPADGRGDGIASEEIVDWLNNTSPYPSAERREQLTSMAAPYEDNDFWEFIYSCTLRGHFELARSVLSTLSSHPSGVLQRLTQSCLDLLAEVPRSTSHIYAYESNFLSAFRKWRSKASAIIARLPVEMDEYQDEIEAQEQDEDGDDADSMDACAEERLGWEAGFNGLLRLLVGDNGAIADASEDGWRSALAAWCLLVRPGLKRDDLPETIEAIMESNPPDPTLFKESMSIALLTGDIAKVLDLATEEDAWLVTHLSDLFAKLGLLRDSRPVDDVSLRDWFILSYTDLLISDPGLWRITVDYYASMENVVLGSGRMREYLLSIGSTSPIEAPGAPTQKEDETAAEEAHKSLEEDGMEVVEKVKVETSKKLASSVEGVLAACVMYGLEDVARSVCLMTAEALIAQKKYGLAVAYCIRANDARRINKICDLLLDEYVSNGEKALSLIDSIPTSLLRPSASPTANAFHSSSLDMFSPAVQDHPVDSHDNGNDATDREIHANALALVASTRLGFLARYRDFHALYASGERVAAAELLVLLMSSNAAPKRFWAIMLLDSVALLNSQEPVVSEQDTLELMRCLNEIVTPVEKSGKRDIYGYLTYLTQAARIARGNKEDKTAKMAIDKQEVAVEEVEAALRQLEVVRYSLTQNLARCFVG